MLLQNAQYLLFTELLISSNSWVDHKHAWLKLIECIIMNGGHKSEINYPTAAIDYRYSIIECRKPDLHSKRHLTKSLTIHLWVSLRMLEQEPQRTTKKPIKHD